MGALQAAMQGQIPGMIPEGLNPAALAGAVGAPFPAGPTGIGGGIRGIPRPNNSPNDPQGLTSPRGGFGAPSMPMGDMPKEGGPTIGPDINAALARNSLMPRNNGMFGGSSGKPDWKMAIAAGLAGLAASRGNPAGQMMLQSMLRMREARQDAELRNQMPQQVGGSLIRLNPETGGYDTLFRDPEVFENYAGSLGLQPGSPEYMDAVRNYRLGAWSPEAVDAKTGLAGYRYDRQGALQEDRQEYGRDMQEDRQTFSQGQFNRRDATTRRGQDLNHQDRQATIRQSDTNNQRTTETSRDNNREDNETRLRTSRKPPRPPAVRVQTVEEARRLAPGTRFIDPNGVERVR